MNISGKKVAIYSLIAIFIIIAIGIGSRYIIFGVVRKKIDEKVEALRAEGFQISYDSLYTNPWDCNLCVKNLAIRFPVSDTTCQEHPTEAIVDVIEVEGLSIVGLILNKRISLEAVRIQNPVIHYAKNYKAPAKKDGEEKAPINGVMLDSLIIINPDITFYDSTTCIVSKHFASTGVSFTDIGFTRVSEDSMLWAIKDFASDEFVAELPEQLYTIRVQRIAYQSATLEMRVDSAAVIPDLEKMAFMRKVGHQTDRIACTIPELVIQQFRLDLLQQSVLEARFAKFSINAEIYRDKRFTRLQRTPTKLPVQFLKTLPLSIRIDSVELAESNIIYEEFPEEGQVAGKISFEKLQARIYNITNNVGEPARMEARAMLMGAGSLAVTFTFPRKADGVYTAKGTLRNFPMPAVNPMLTPLANAEIKSGTLNEMSFDFKYNEFRSDGTLMMNYKDLELISFKKDNSQEANKLVSFLIGLFVKKDMDKNTAIDKKTGTILFYRDDQRAIFNYWWKSLLSGVKAVYNVDKLTNADGKKEAK